MIDKVKERADHYFSKLVEIRKHLHQHPELSFEENKTADFVFSTLKSVGLHPERMAKTGVVAMINGGHSGPVIALRADLDALPIQEMNDVPYKSLNNGVMHACGHDVHTASLLGAAMILNDLKADLSGSIKLIFQPGEEKLPGGASIMIKEGVLENPKPASIVGQHVFPELEVGKVGFRSGMYMASCDEIHITVKGKGGHGAMPHLAIDPVLISSHLVIALQQVVSRKSNPLIPSVLSIGKFIANGATNVIPDQVKLEGTFRTFDEEWRIEAHQEIMKIAENLVSSMGGTCDIDIKKGYPFVYNDEELTERSRLSAAKYLGEQNVVELPMRATGEDFSFYTQAMPGTFYRLGVANAAKGITHPVHSAHFDADEEALRIGSGLMAWIAMNELK
ncbi:MAG TPA: amidohydrolase [Flavobacteriales bacterium]|jgi:amidohydrolase|nr:amidohydrolase [Flavobacteriales bacterium]